MRFYADLHIHSKYSRATSKQCDLEHLSYWGRRKGITVIGTGDFTHPAWFNEIQEKLVPAEPGLFRLREDIEREVLQRLPASCHGSTRFMLSVEVSTIYKKGDKTRKIHHLIYAPTLEKAALINQKLERIGNIKSDGRPILGLDSRHLLEIVLEAGDECYLVPAHIWTPWFAVLGSKSGFDTIGECYGDLAEHIFAVETGLSSDPEMNWRISDLDRYRLVSNSDAHSPAKLGRESCLFHTDLNYFSIRRALETGTGYGGTVEFFPEEGKYHLDGHRQCGVRLSPEESRAHAGICPVCKKPLTLGVLYRVQELADRSTDERPAETDPFVSLVPLPEVIAETEKVGPTSKRAAHEYDQLLHKLGAELPLLNDVPLDELNRLAGGSLIPEAIARMRAGEVIREAGYDGEYGKIKLFREEELTRHTTIAMFDLPALDSDSTPASSVEPPQPQKKPSLVSAATPCATQPRPAPAAVAGHSLDPEQQQALSVTHGPLLIIAGPGSGKTRVLTHRVAHLVTQHIATPEQCLTITFSRRAASEMCTRLRTLLPTQWTQIPSYTFHALAYQILRTHRLAAGLPRGFRVCSEQERRQFLLEQGAGSVSKADRILREINRRKRQGLMPTPDDNDEVGLFWARLAQRKDTHGWLDYDDLMLGVVQLLAHDPGLQASYRQRYPWISIDEYQDIDALQYRLVQLLTPSDGNLCAIGDPDQSIYAFRGAQVGFFLRFEQDFPSAQTIQLTRNYRSAESIVTASTQMITPASLLARRPVRALLAKGGKLVVHEASSEKAEAEFVIHAIESAIGGISFFSLDSGRSDGARENHYGFADFAVLYRTDAQADALEAAFARSGIPYQRHTHRCLSDHPRVQALLDILLSQRGDGPLTEDVEQAIAALASAATKPEEHASLDVKLRELAHQCDSDRGRFISQLHLDQDSDLWDERADRCALLTLHAAKGLEFPVVFITGCEEGLLPLKWGGRPNPEALAEERRLFYVGMTRAQDQLFLSHARKRLWRGQRRPREASSFLSDIQRELIDISQGRRFTKDAEKTSQMELF